MTARIFSFGTLPDGPAVPALTIANGNGIEATLLAYGATLQSLLLPDRHGKIADVAIGHATLDEYLAKRAFLGSTVGRFANRLAHGRFELDGATYQTPCNDGANALHGGEIGFDRVLWEVAESGPSHVVFRHVSRDGDQGYPGTLTVEARYALTEDDRLDIDYRATTDRPTIVNITNHAYWNLAGTRTAEGAMGHVLRLPAEAFLPTDAGSIPTGELRPVAGTPFDFRAASAIGERVRDAADAQIAIGRGYDHNWVFGDSITPDQRLLAELHDPVSGRGFALWSNQPGLQFYSGNFLDGTMRDTSGRLLRQGDAIVLEPQLFPDAPNQPGFPDARLAPGETYLNRISYRFARG